MLLISMQFSQKANNGGHIMTSSNENISVLLALCPWNSPHTDQWHGTLMFSLICAWTSVWVNTRDTGDLRRHGTHQDVTVMQASCDTDVWVTPITHILFGNCIYQLVYVCFSVWYCRNYQWRCTLCCIIINKIYLRSLLRQSFCRYLESLESQL